jgi:hypothetical protein
MNVIINSLAKTERFYWDEPFLVILSVTLTAGANQTMVGVRVPGKETVEGFVWGLIHATGTALILGKEKRLFVYHLWYAVDRKWGHLRNYQAMKIKLGEDGKQLELVPIPDGDEFEIANIPAPDEEGSDGDEDQEYESGTCDQMYNIWLGAIFDNICLT